MFQEDNGEVKLFVNYQQLHGKGMAGLSKSMDEMVRFINQFKLEQTGFVFLVDAKGHVQLHRDGTVMGKRDLSDLYGQSTAQALLQKNDFNLRQVDRDGQAILLATSYIPAMNWYVVAEVPLAETFAALDQARQQIMVWTGGIATVFVLLAIWLGSNITRPIAQLAQTFKDLGEGEGDLRHRIPVNGRDEMAQLAEGLTASSVKSTTRWQMWQKPETPCVTPLNLLLTKRKRPCITATASVTAHYNWSPRLIRWVRRSMKLPATQLRPQTPRTMPKPKLVTVRGW